MSIEFSKYDLERKITIPVQSEKLAEFFGILAGDGYVIDAGRIHKFGLSLNLTEDVIYAKFVTRMIKELFDLEPAVMARDEFGVLELTVSSMAVARFILSIGFPNRSKKGRLHVPEWILRNKAYTRAFLRGLFDTDGSLFFAKRGTYKLNKYPVIEIKAHDEPFLIDVEAAVKSIGLSCIRQKDRIQLNGRRLTSGWIECVGSSNLNQTSKYFVWKKFSFCPPGTCLRERLGMICGNGKANKASGTNLV